MDPATVAVMSTALAALVGGVVALVRIAVSESRSRADDWREIARTAQAAAVISNDQVKSLVTAVQALTVAQQDSLVLIQSNAAALERWKETAP